MSAAAWSRMAFAAVVIPALAIGEPNVPVAESPSAAPATGWISTGKLGYLQLSLAGFGLATLTLGAGFGIDVLNRPPRARPTDEAVLSVAMVGAGLLMLVAALVVIPLVEMLRDVATYYTSARELR